ncbi:glutathionylspermidine synthase family protein [Rhizobium leguminosarum]|jgi:glutathionylspermidine synthase|uniref:Glutathionylspermidine synthase n=1 Tax=Rhizobium leguminosarum bv. trifolii (strain WSM1325) TaxID=395491 RepID=C6B5X7_RHILS|nr:glutathionylspermidine synthase family protein [Rhizobium leguminosarum]ACS59485.1 glutathionylspermidine synthase [Rhizobium leguminosarum bv. trifolii WSM1325]MBY2925674.1 glutathionylspermidine synthase family protein [Rhizobium leguminosarum]MBY2937333.1 glutathionylspermidine synthase family protein [Rhizobium leguminosarum]MBY2951376.1 glutathionylspermidine synthase family protein [Rhizobium leguminosarum]MBY2963946.1 glutathionylspermidine synthase family protein [Rhizobium legumino
MKRITLPARPDWLDKARAVGFGFHVMYGEPYWLDDAAYTFTLDEIETRIEEPSQELHDMCMDLVDDIVRSEESLDKLAIPEDLRDVVQRSWQRRDRHLYGRFDLAYDGTGPVKLLEYNADTPTSVFETAYFQFNWLTDQVALGILPKDADQYNSLQESLVEAFEQFSKEPIFHFAAMTDNEEDRGTTVYLMDCAVQAGHRVELLDIREIGIDAQGRYTDLKDRVIDRCFKLYPWEFMLREPFARDLVRSGDVFVEPAWKAVLSNKGLLPLLWQRHPNHPNLLASYFADDPAASSLSDYVRKPLLSREGENVTIFRDGRELISAPGDYGDEGFIVQAYAPLFESDGGFAVLGSWIVGDRACGLAVREDRSRITANLSRFVPHVIVG